MPLIGECQQMCPEEEISQRLLQDKFSISPFECDFEGNFRPELAIKTFHRSDASKIYKAEDIRPLPVLIKTHKHIFDFVIKQKTNTVPGTSEIQMFHYVSDKLRSIRNDIIIQGLYQTEVIDIYEKNLLFYIWAGLKFYRMDLNEFDPTQNLEQITQTFLSLKEQYDNYLSVNGKHSKNEFFFSALDLITFIERDEFMSKLMQLSTEIINSKYIKAVLKIKEKYENNLITEFFECLENLPIQFVSYVFQNCSGIWKQSILYLRKGYCSNFFPLELFTNTLKIKSEDLEKIYCVFNITVDKEKCKFNVKENASSHYELPNLFVPESFEKIDDVNNCLNFVNNLSITEENMDQVKDNNFENSSCLNNFKAEIKQETILPKKQEEILQKPIEESKKILNVDTTEEIKREVKPIALKTTKPKHSQEYLTPTVPKNIPKPNIQQNKSNFLEILAMIPDNIPPISYSTVLLVADDESSSSNFALNYFDFINSDTAICGKFTNQKSNCYILVTRNREHPSISSILNCQEINPLEYSEIPVILFNELSGYSTQSAFSSCLRKSILAGITEIKPYDISDFIYRVLSGIGEIIQTSSWRNSTANSIISLYNICFEVLSDFFLSKEFISLLLPFEHNLLTYDMLYSYCQSLLSMKINLLNYIQSNHVLSGTNWPRYILSNIKFDIQKFIVPICKSFDPQTYFEFIIYKIFQLNINKDKIL